MTTDLIRRDPGILGGTPVFAGSRVPVKTVMDYLEAGETIDAFLDDFPTVPRHQLLSFLEIALARATAEPA
jgi:uncharacterized protein (DUF433 family)